MRKLLFCVFVASLLSGLALAQQAAPDAVLLQLASDTLEAMGQKPDPARTEQVWRSGFLASQTKYHHFSDAQAEAFFQVMKPTLEARDQKLFAVKQQFLARTMSHDELTQVLAFYRTPTGVKLVESERQAEPEFLAAQQATSKDVFAKTMAAAMAMPTSAPQHTATSPRQSP